MELAALPGHVRKLFGNGIYDALMSVRGYHPHSGKTTGFQVLQEGISGLLALISVSAEPYDFPIAFAIGGVGNHKRLGNHPGILSDLEVSGIYGQELIFPGKRSFPKLPDFSSSSLQASETVDLEKLLPQRVSMTWDTLRVETPLTHISAMVMISAASLRQ
jgi:hypothetical protein